MIANSDDTPKFDDVAGDFMRIAVGDPVDGWRRYADAYDVPERPFTACTDVADSLLIYFTSGTTSKPKLVEHSQVSYPVGTCRRWRGSGCARRWHLAISSAGWAKHAWSCFFARGIAEATIFVYNYSRFDAAALLGQSARRPSLLLRSTHGVAHTDPVRPRRQTRRPARDPGAGEPLTPTSSRRSSVPGD